MPDATQPYGHSIAPIETGIRAPILLAESYPQQLDLQRILEFDYIMVHTGDVDGPPASIPRCRFDLASFWSGGNLSRRGLLLMISRGLDPTPRHPEWFHIRGRR